MITEIVRALAAAGATPEMICAAVEAAEADSIRIASERRQKARDRKRAQRSRDVTGTDGDNAGQSVTEWDNPSLDKESSPTPPKETKPFPKENPPKGGQKKGTRIGDFVPSVEAAVSMGLPRKASEAEARKFVDYWRGASGANAIKSDWPATWRNWVRRAMEQLGIAENTPSGNELMVPKHDPRWQFLVARWERENSKKFPDLADKWPFPELWLKDANKPEEPDMPEFLRRPLERTA